MKTEIEESEKSSKMMQVLDWAYEKSLNGVPGMPPVIEFAEQYKNKSGSLESNVNSLIRWQMSKTATSGFLTGLGGLITLPVAVHHFQE